MLQVQKLIGIFSNTYFVYAGCAIYLTDYKSDVKEKLKTISVKIFLSEAKFLCLLL